MKYNDTLLFIAKELDIKIVHPTFYYTAATYSETSDTISISTFLANTEGFSLDECLIHELMHATGHRSRLDRSLNQAIQDEVLRIREEYIANSLSLYFANFLNLKINKIQEYLHDQKMLLIFYGLNPEDCNQQIEQAKKFILKIINKKAKVS